MARSLSVRSRGKTKRDRKQSGTPDHRRPRCLKAEFLEGRFLLSTTLVVANALADQSPPLPTTLVTSSYQYGVSPDSSYRGSRDTEITSAAMAANRGDESLLKATGSPDSAILMKWYLNDIPKGSTVQSAKLTLHVTDASTSHYELYALKRDWGEGQATWLGNVTGKTWETPGAQGPNDRGSTVLGTATPTASGQVTITLNAAGIAAVQSWVNNPASNYGLILQDYAATDSLQITSRETRVQTQRPKLTVTYSTAGSTPVTRSYQYGVSPNSTYTGSRDTEITSAAPTANRGDESLLKATGSSDSAILMKWYLNDIPKGSTVQSAKLTLHVTDASTSHYELYALKRDWGEGQATWLGNVTGNTWETPGAQGPNDRGSTVLGTATLTAPGLATITLNAAGIAAVQSWVNDPACNYGLILQDYAATDSLQIASRETRVQTQRPKLTVSYTSAVAPAAENKAPVVQAGEDQRIGVNKTLNLDGTVIDDKLPNPPGAVTTTWSKVSGPGTVTFGNPAAVDTQVRFSQLGTYVLRLRAYDGLLAASDDITVTVTDPYGNTRGVYVSPTGKSTGDGSVNNPWDLKTALSKAGVVQPGTTVWLRGGTYRGGLAIYANGTAGAPIVVAPYPGEHAKIDTYDGIAGNDGAVRVFGNYVDLRNLEIMCSDPRIRITSETGSSPTGIVDRGEVKSYGNYNRFINLVVHDLRIGFGASPSGTGGEIYGSIVYNNGWVGPERGSGHAMYLQNQNGTKRIADNIIFNQFGYGIHAYGSAPDGQLKGFDFEGNVSFNNGGGQGEGYTRPDFLVGGQVVAENIKISNNYTYQNNGNSEFRVGYAWGPDNKNLTMTNNYVAGEVQFNKGWSSVKFNGNTIVRKAGPVLNLLTAAGGSTAAYQWDNNRYVSAAAEPLVFQGDGKTWSQWCSATGLDDHGQMTAAAPSGTQVFVRPNEYEEGRANVIVYNWDQKPTVTVDLSKALTVGATYEIRHVLNLSGAPVLKGVYDGKPVQLPITAMAAPKPIAYNGTPAGTSREFGVFVVSTIGMPPLSTPTAKTTSVSAADPVSKAAATATPTTVEVAGAVATLSAPGNQAASTLTAYVASANATDAVLSRDLAETPPLTLATSSVEKAAGTSSSAGTPASLSPDAWAETHSAIDQYLDTLRVTNQRRELVERVLDLLMRSES